MIAIYALFKRQINSLAQQASTGAAIYPFYGKRYRLRGGCGYPVSTSRANSARSAALCCMTTWTALTPARLAAD